MSEKIPDGWKKVKLGEVCTDISYGYTASAKSNPIGPKFLRITDIVSDRINWETVPYCKISDKNTKKYKLEIGDIVIARTGATTGYNKTIKDDIESVFASYLIRYRINKEIADPFFVGYNLQSYNWYGFVENIIGGSAQPGANAKQFADFEFYLPPLLEQKAIASVLSSLDDKIDLLHRQNKTLEQMAETLFRQWFIEEAKEDWKDKPLGEVVNIKYGKNLLTSKLCEIGYPVFGGNGQIGFYKAYMYKKPQVLISCRGAASGKVIISSPYSFVTNNSLILEIPEGSILNFEFLKYYALTTDFSMYVSGSAQPQITINDITNAELILPTDKNIIKRFSEIVRPIEQKILDNQRQICTLEKLRDTLLPKLMSGEVMVRTDAKQKSQ